MEKTHSVTCHERTNSCKSVSIWIQYKTIKPEIIKTQSIFLFYSLKKIMSPMKIKVWNERMMSWLNWQYVIKYFVFFTWISTRATQMHSFEIHSLLPYICSMYVLRFNRFISLACVYIKIHSVNTFWFVTHFYIFQ